MQRLAVPFTLCAVWFMAAWAIEKFWFSAICGPCSTLFAFELGVKGQHLLNISTGRVSAVVLFGVPFLVYALVLIPYRHPGSGAAWSEAISQWSRPFFWLVMVVFWVWIGEIAYSVLIGTLPDGFRVYGDGYQLHLSGTALAVREITVNGRFGAFVGLILGLYLFLSRGFARR